MSGKVLFIAVGFPPLGGSGVQRSTKFAKYLPGFGWRAAVLTGDPERDCPEELDPSLLAEIPKDVEIRRVPYWNPAGRLFSLLHALYSRRPGLKVGIASLATPTERPAPGTVGCLRRAFHAARQFLCAPVGDDYFYWSRRARPAALEFSRTAGARAVYVSAGPYTALLLGLWLKRRTGLPFVADFRDPWTFHGPESFRKGPRFRLQRGFERRVLRGADAVIAVNETMQAQFEQIEPGCRGRVEVIPNGFDPGDFAAPAPAVLKAHELVHAGVVWEDGAKPVLRALAALRARGGLPGSFRTRFIGGLPHSSLRLVEELGLAGAVSVEPRKAHAEAVAAMRGAGFLLLLISAQGHFGTVVPAKAFEYLAAARPVLCVAPPGPAAELVRESGCGLAVEPEDSAGLERAIAGLAQDPAGWEARHFHPRAEVIARFDRRQQAGRLAGILDRVAGGKARP